MRLTTPSLATGAVAARPPAGPPMALSAPPAIGAGMAMPSTGSIPIAAQHFAAALLFLLAGGIGLVWVAPELAAGLYASPHVAGVTHLFTLGWLTTTIFGALHQLLPVALGAPVRSPRVGHVAFWTFVPGAALFAAGVASSVTALHHAGIALVAVGIVLAVGNVAASLPRARSRDVVWGAVAIAIGFLSSTLVLGVVLLHNLHTGFLAEARLRVLAVHLHVAIVGWALVMIVGVSHRLLPMFLLAHGAGTAWTRRALALLATGVIALAIGIPTQSALTTWLGVALLEGGVAAFVWQAAAFYRARVRKKIDVGMRFVGTGILFLIVAALLGPALLVAGPMHARLATDYVLVGLLGGVVTYVVGHFYKIVPMLAWNVRYRDRMGRETVPTIAETFSAGVAHVQLAVMTLGVVVMALGTALGHGHCVRVGALLWTLGVVLFASQIARTAFGRPRE